MKRKYLLLAFAILFFIIACAEKPESNSSDKDNYVKNDTTEFYSFIKKFDKKDSIIFVELDKLSITESIDSIEDGGANIKNEDELIEKFELSPTVEIVMQTLNHDSTGRFNFNEKISVEEFTMKLDKPEFERFLFTPFKIQTVNNKITTIKEKYLP